MDIEQAKQEITTLREKLEYYAKKYYDDDKPEISDYEYDMMMNQLKKLEKQRLEIEQEKCSFFSKLLGKAKVGGHVKEGFAQITHEVPLQSLQDVFSFEELIEFDLRVKKQLEVQDVNYVVETKIDGLSVALEYVNGEFIRGATRGNGLIGEDVTDNLKTIKNIPRKLKDNITITVRGEVFIGTAEFEKLNQEREVLRREFICECKKCGGWVT